MLWTIAIICNKITYIFDHFSVRAEIGLSSRLSSFNRSLLPKKPLCHRKTFALLEQSLPYTCCINQNISDALLPSLAWNLITALFSISKSTKNLFWEICHNFAIYQPIEVKLVLPEKGMSQLSKAGLNT